ncbi:MAG TPA: hypothetical protein VFA53_04730 [Xanthobacteraceae bacterium]|nr:hypothetical protein [Xanthobacteraceae bacterium]
MFLIGFPLLIIPFALYNMFVFLFGVSNWAAPVAAMRLMSGAQWTMTWGDVLIALSALLLFVEFLKSARIGLRNVVDHLLSVLVFAGMLAEFTLVQDTATSTFFLLIVISFLDVLGGLAIRPRRIPQKLKLESADRVAAG